jgi:hypothetical protein
VGRAANVTSFSALEAFEMALSKFAYQAEAALEIVQPALDQKLRVLEARCQQCEAEVEAWQSTYDSADPEEDDMGHIAYRLDQAETKLNNVRFWQNRIEQALHEYLSRAGAFRASVIDENPTAKAFVQQKLATLRAYTALKAETSDLDGVALPLTPTVSDAAESLARITEMRLPNGFEWVPISSLDAGETASLSEVEYKKDGLDEGDMSRAFEILRNEVLPAIQNKSTQADSDYFWKLDQEKGRAGIDSSQGVYDAFFRGDAIWVDRFIGQRHFRIGNGKHRIRAAIAAGWPAVPAKVMQASLRKTTQT